MHPPSAFSGSKVFEYIPIRPERGPSREAVIFYQGFLLSCSEALLGDVADGAIIVS